jgi:hypothetical protein
MESYDPRMIGDLDETMLKCAHRSLKVVKRGTRFAVSTEELLKEHITILHLIIAGGTSFIPMFIFQLKTVPTLVDDLVKNKKLFVAGQSSGWITEQLFEEYMKLFAEWLPEYKKSCGLDKNARFLLFSDSHSSRKDSDLLKWRKSKFIDIVTFPSHCTHILQPLDVGVYAVFKKYFAQERRRVRHWKFEFQGETPSAKGLLRVKNVIAAIEALHLSSSPLQIGRSFRHSGIYPWNVEAAFRNPRIHPDETITIDNRKRKGLQMDGIVITSESFLKELEKDERSRRDKKKKVEV